MVASSGVALSEGCQLPPLHHLWPLHSSRTCLSSLVIWAVCRIMVQCHACVTPACVTSPACETTGIQTWVDLSPVSLTGCCCFSPIVRIIHHPGWPPELTACSDDFHHVSQHGWNSVSKLCCHHTDVNGKALHPSCYIWYQALL